MAEDKDQECRHGVEAWLQTPPGQGWLQTPSGQRYRTVVRVDPHGREARLRAGAAWLRWVAESATQEKAQGGYGR